MHPYYKNELKKVSDAIYASGKSRILVGIDGCGCSGKTTFANELLEISENAFLVQMDDFYKPKSEINRTDPFILFLMVTSPRQTILNNSYHLGRYYYFVFF